MTISTRTDRAKQHRDSINSYQSDVMRMHTDPLVAQDSLRTVALKAAGENCSTCSLSVMLKFTRLCKGYVETTGNKTVRDYNICHRHQKK